MFRNPDLSFAWQWPRVAAGLAVGMRLGLPARLASALLACALLAGCSVLPWKSSRAKEHDAAQIAAQAAEAKAVAEAAVNAAASSPVVPPAPPVPPAPDSVTRLLSYAERVRLMQPAELTQETARLAAPGEVNLPASQLQLSLVLSQLRQLPDLIRAQELLARVLANGGPDAQALHPLARLLAFRYGEQRRLEDYLEKERQQTREVQRRLDQTNERLEALKAIERSLTARPPPPAAVPVPAPPPAPLAPLAPPPASAPASRARTNP